METEMKHTLGIIRIEQRPFRLPAYHEQTETRLVSDAGIDLLAPGDLLTEAANAAHVLRCWNSHDGLVAALAALLHEFAGGGERTISDFEVIQMAKSAMVAAAKESDL